MTSYKGIRYIDIINKYRALYQGINRTSLPEDMKNEIKQKIKILLEEELYIFRRPELWT